MGLFQWVFGRKNKAKHEAENVETVDNSLKTEEVPVAEGLKPLMPEEPVSKTKNEQYQLLQNQKQKVHHSPVVKNPPKQEEHQVPKREAKKQKSKGYTIEDAMIASLYRDSYLNAFKKEAQECFQNANKAKELPSAHGDFTELHNAICGIQEYVRENQCFSSSEEETEQIDFVRHYVTPLKRLGFYENAMHGMIAHVEYDVHGLTADSAKTLFKILACAGDAIDALNLFIFVTGTEVENHPYYQTLKSHALALMAAIEYENPYTIENYLATISGNEANYHFDRKLLNIPIGEGVCNHLIQDVTNNTVSEKDYIPSPDYKQKTLQAAKEAYNNGKWQEAKQMFLLSAQAGNAEAQWYVGECCQRLYDNISAIDWYRKSAAQGFLDAQNSLGLAYMDGAGVDRDYKMAFQWLNMAAEQNNDHALINLAGLYFDGRGVQQDDEKGFELALKSANMGNPTAQLTVSIWGYVWGRGAEVDEKKAFEWCKKAARQNSGDAQWTLSCFFYSKGIGVAKNRRAELYWLKKAASNGYLSAQRQYSSLKDFVDFDSLTDADADPEEHENSEDKNDQTGANINAKLEESENKPDETEVQHIVENPTSEVAKVTEKSAEMPFAAPLDLSSLNKEQIEAVKTTEGYVRVVASAGSGKTRALTYRYCYLANDLNISPQNIVCITFTNKAANEMKERIRNLTNISEANLRVSTIHSLCVKILRKEVYRLGWRSNFRILDDADSSEMLIKINRRLTGRSEKAYALKETIATYKTTNNYCELFNKNKTTPVLSRQLPQQYITKQKQMECLDFNDLILVTVYLLNKYDDARKYWAEQCKYVMVDEFQDVSQGNYDFCELISSVHHNLFVVGDSDQLIYGWRGAQMKFFMDFDKVHRDAKTIYLNANYRSDRQIITAANNLIRHNHNRIDKDMIGIAIPDGTVITVNYDTLSEAADFVRNKINEITQTTKYTYKDVAILYRAGYVSAPFEQALTQAKIPYKIFGGEPFYQRREIKDLLAFLTLVNSGDAVSLERALTFAQCPIDDAEIESFISKANDEDHAGYSVYTAFLERYAKVPQFANFIAMIADFSNRVSNYTVSELILYIASKAGFERKYRRPDSEKLENRDDPWANIMMLVNNALDMERKSEEPFSLSDFLAEISTLTSVDEENAQNAVNMMTIHGSKGLEFPVVFCVGWNEGIFPDWRNKEGEELEEERRMAYVAYTRAQHQLYVVSATHSGYGGRTNDMSRFVEEMKDEIVPSNSSNEKNNSNKEKNVYNKFDAERDYEKALDFQKDEQYIEAIPLFFKSATFGLPEAQYHLGQCFDFGRGVDQDKEEAVNWYRKAAEQGLANAQADLGISYYSGEGVETDFSQAFYWLQKAAAQDQPNAICTIGHMYEKGNYVLKDEHNAFSWYLKAANLGDPSAQANVAIAYLIGRGVEVNAEAAAEWNEKAAEQGHATAQFNLAKQYARGAGVSINQEMFMYWLHRAADNGHPQAIAILAQNGLL